MNNEQQQIIDEAYKNWCKQFEVDPNNFNVDELVKGHNDQCWGYPTLDHVKPTSKEYKRGQVNAYLEGKAEKPFFYLTQEEFINKCQTNDDFAGRWGCKIVIKELSIQERIKLGNFEFGEAVTDEKCDKQNIPTKLITVIYTEKIESYV
jgi:hypothetical protein